jgi:hypothetical protein
MQSSEGLLQISGNPTYRELVTYRRVNRVRQWLPSPRPSGSYRVMVRAEMPRAATPTESTIRQKKERLAVFPGAAHWVLRNRSRGTIVS